MRKKILILISMITLAAAALMTTVWASESDPTVYTEGTLYYTISNNSITITGCFGKKEEVTVPAMIAGYPVNTIAKGAFTSNTYIKKLNLPDTISKVEDGAIPDGLKVIYNANTDHPQDTPTELILNGGVLNPTEPVKPTDNPIETDPVKPDPITPDPTKEVTVTPETTPSPQVTDNPTVQPTDNPSGQPTTAPSEEPTPTPDNLITPDPDETQVEEQDGDLSDFDVTPTPTVQPSPVPTPTPVPADSAANAETKDSTGKKGGNVLPIILIVLLIAAAAGGSVVVVNMKKNKK